MVVGSLTVTIVVYPVLTVSYQLVLSNSEMATSKEEQTAEKLRNAEGENGRESNGEKSREQRERGWGVSRRKHYGNRRSYQNTDMGLKGENKKEETKV